ncbi:hypothetical protein [Nitrospira sp. Nam74]
MFESLLSEDITAFFIVTLPSAYQRFFMPPLSLEQAGAARAEFQSITATEIWITFPPGKPSATLGYIQDCGLSSVVS